MEAQKQRSLATPCAASMGGGQRAEVDSPLIPTTRDRAAREKATGPSGNRTRGTAASLKVPMALLRAFWRPTSHGQSAHDGMLGGRR